MWVRIMGTKAGKSSKSILSGFKIHGNEGSIAQLLHPCWASRSVSQVKPFLKKIDKELGEEVKLIISGGGLIEIVKSSEKMKIKDLKSEEMLEELVEVVDDKIQPISTLMKQLDRDYIIGVDVIIDDDGYMSSVGQFAVVFSRGKQTIVWKSYPIEDEDGFLAGFGTDRGRNSPRIVSTSVGNGIVLVCHDSQAYNSRNRGSVANAKHITSRRKVMDIMDAEMHDHKPEWAFNLIHWIEKSQNLTTFSKSYKQIYNDYTWKPMTIGAFGYGKKVAKDLDGLAEKVRPFQEGGTVIILEAAK
jgi:hypothetical protein